MPEKVIDGLTDEALIALIQRTHEAIKPQRKEGEFTSKDYGDVNGISQRSAHTELTRLEQEGIVNKRYAQSRMVFWSFVKPE